MSKVLIFKDDKIWIIRKGKELEIPNPKERREIIMKAHLLGHFQKMSIFNLFDLEKTNIFGNIC